MMHPFYTRDLRISRRVVPFLTNQSRSGTRGWERGGGEEERGGEIGLSIDGIINEIRRAGLETNLTLSQCNIALESMLTIIVINIIIIIIMSFVIRRGMILIGAQT